jgi:hypothetical protein
MKKTVVIAFLFVAGAAFGQEFTFQGLPWGSTREQVIEKLGQPYKNTGMLQFDSSISGYLSLLNIDFDDNNSMCSAWYDVGRFQRLNNTQLKLAFIALVAQITEKYGSHHEIITQGPFIKNDEEQFYLWHFNNFHIMINTIVDDSSLHIFYCSTKSWNEYENVMKENKMIRFPNKGL